MPPTAQPIGFPTLIDVLTNMAPDGSMAPIVEALKRRVPFLNDIPAIEGNSTQGHIVTTRTGLPSIGWVKFNQGVAAGVSKENQFTETCGMLEGKSNVDCRLAELNGNVAAFRQRKDNAFLQSFRHELESGAFYHSAAATPEKFNGLTPRLNNLSSGAYKNQIVSSPISSSGSDQTSIWGIVWGPDSVYSIYPKGTRGGLQHHDMGEQMVADSDGNTFRAYQTLWNWYFGLVVEDARQIVRLCNIDTSAIAKTGKLLLEGMISAYHRLEDPTAGHLVWYANRKMGEYLHQQAVDTGKGSGLDIRQDLETGKPVTHFLGSPIRITDALLNTEDVVS